MDIISYLLGKKAGGGGGDVNVQSSKNVTITENTTTTVNPDTGYDALGKVNVTTNVTQAGLYTVDSIEEMNEIQDANVGDLCIVQGEELKPWVLGVTNSNVFCFPKEVDIEDIKNELISEYGGSVSFWGTTINEETNINAYIEISDNEFVLNMNDYEYDDSLRIQYSYVNGKFVRTAFDYYYNDTYIPAHGYTKGFIVRKAYNMYASIDTPLIKDLFGRFVKTIEYNKLDNSIGSNCIYFPLEIEMDEPFSIPFFLTFNDVSHNRIDITNDSADFYIGVSNDHGVFSYIWNEDSKKYELSSESISGQNVIFSPNSKIKCSATNVQYIQEVIDAGLIQVPNSSIPKTYIKDTNKWDKISSDGSPYEC